MKKKNNPLGNTLDIGLSAIGLGIQSELLSKSSLPSSISSGIVNIQGIKLLGKVIK